MSVTGKTFGIILIGLVGLLAFIGLYIVSALGFYTPGPSAFKAVASYATVIGVALTFFMLAVIAILTAGREG